MLDLDRLAEPCGAEVGFAPTQKEPARRYCKASLEAFWLSSDEFGSQALKAGCIAGVGEAG